MAQATRSTKSQVEEFANTLLALRNFGRLGTWLCPVLALLGKVCSNSPIHLGATASTVSTPAPSTTERINPFAVAEHGLSAAYSDCHKHHPGSSVPERNLHFCCPVTVSLAQARRLLARYVSGYNEFAPKRLLALPPACRVRLARESSVCLYVETTEVLDGATIRHEMRCDEFDLYQVLAGVRTYRLWWD